MYGELELLTLPDIVEGTASQNNFPGCWPDNTFLNSAHEAVVEGTPLKLDSEGSDTLGADMVVIDTVAVVTAKFAYSIPVSVLLLFS